MIVNEVAKKYEEYAIALRRRIHQQAEASMEEYQTSAMIQAELDQIGIPWVKCGGETGILCTIRGVKPGKTILLRGDMDALSVTEETGLPYASQNQGMMHACGHDAHTAALLTAAHILHDLRECICGTVKLAFQPGEEVALGAKSMVAEGALEGVDACFGLHIWLDLPVGKISIEEGPRLASADRFRIDVKGRGGHGSLPHQCVDAGVAAAAILTNLQTIVSRETDPNKMAVCSVGRVEIGSRWNVVPEYGYLEGTTRCYDPQVYAQWPEQLTRIASGTAALFRAEAKVTVDRLTPPLINAPEITQQCAQAASKLFGPDCLAHVDASSGSEDFAFFTERVPGAFAFVGARNPQIDAVYPHHSGKFRLDESAVLTSAALYAQVALDYTC